MAEHSLLSDPDIHEPKGISSSSAGKVYIADGLGSGSWEYPSGGAYGEILISGGITSQTLPAASAYAQLNPEGEWGDGLYSNVSLSSSNGQMTASIAGIYKMDFWCTFSTASLAAGVKYYFKYAVNGVTSSRFLSVQKNTAGTDVLTCSASGILSANLNDVISIYVAGDATSSSTNIIVNEAGLNMTLLKV